MFSRFASTVLPVLLLFTLLSGAAARPAASDDGEPALASNGHRFDLATIGRALGHPLHTVRDQPRRVTTLERRDLGGGIAHYRFELTVAAGDHGRIGVHRVVRELRPYIPHPTRHAVMLAHGDAFPFVTTYLTSTLVPELSDTSNLAAFLAAGGVDVWGIDFRWSLVPQDTEDLAFMADIGLGTDADDLRIALLAARLLRGASGSGFGRLHLAGYSRGGQTGYAYLSAESQRPSFLRHVRGFIPIDIMAKTDDEGLRQRACANAADAQARLDAGSFASPGAIIAELGRLALDDPDGVSPFIPFFTNGNLLRLIGADVDDDLSPTFHRTGGTIDAETLDTTLTFSPDRAWYAWNAGIAAFEPWRVVLEGESLRCDVVDLPFDDHFDDITVPVLYVGAAGGFGDAGVFNTTLLGSTDVSALIVAALGTGEAAADIGHVDLFIATEAEDRVWRPIRDWILAR